MPQKVKGALIGVGIAVALLLPPIIHFVSGPLGPLVGGFVGGAKTCRGDPNGAVVMGLLMGVFMAAIVAVPVLITALLFDVLPGSTVVLTVVIPLGMGLYTGLLGILGAVLGSRQGTGAEAQG